MSIRMYCSHCGAYVGDCGHVPGGLTAPVTLSSTCSNCNQHFSVTCNGSGLMTAAEEVDCTNCEL